MPRTPRTGLRMTLAGSFLGLGILAASLPAPGDDYHRSADDQSQPSADRRERREYPGFRSLASQPQSQNNQQPQNQPYERYGSVQRTSTSSLDDLRRGFSARGRSDENEADDEPQFDPKAANVQLRFFNATWGNVLRKVAEDSHSELVMDKVPPGRFNRFHPRKFTRKEAVRILNEELQKSNFRLVEKGKYLDVLHLKSARATYHRHELPEYSPPKPDDRWDSPPVAKPERSVHTIAAREPKIPAGGGRKLRKVSDYDVKRAVHSLPSRINGLTQLNDADAGEPVTRSVRTRNRDAVDVARAIFDPLRKQQRAKMIHAGPGGLPGFQVFAAIPEPASSDERRGPQPAVRAMQKQALFSVGIDETKDELVVEAPKSQNAEVVRLIQFLDDTRVRRGESLRVISTRSNPTPIAETLRPQIDRLAQANQNRQPEQQPQQQPEQQQDQKLLPLPPGAGPAVQSLMPLNIRGRVIIREVPGVGLVIIGNREDVEAVQQIIKQLDAQGLITTPNVTIHSLRHVNSQALAELLNSVYSQLATIRAGEQQQVSGVGFIAVLHPNALMIISSQQGLKSVLELVDQLDRPIDPENEFRVFHLKSAVASQVVANLDLLFQQQQQQAGAQAGLRGLAMRVRAIANVRTNSIIVEAAPNDMKIVASLIEKLDTQSIPSVSRVKVVKLKNAVATELAELLNTSIQSVINPPILTGQAGAGAGTGGAQELRDPKSTVLEFMMPEGDRRRLLKSGMLSDIRITPDPRINALVVTAPEISMGLLEQLIEQLDLPSELVAEIKVFTLANGDATGMASLLATLFPVQQQGAGQQQAGVQVATADDASSGLIPLRFAVEPRTNSIIAIGGSAALSVVEAVIFRLDERDQRQRQTAVVKLRNAPVTEVATAINTFLTSQRNLAQIDPTIVTNMELLEREIIVVPEAVSNSVLISATPRYFGEIRAIVERLDQAPPQVIIQALIVEVELNNTDEFGVELGFQDPLLFARGLTSDVVLGPETTTTAPNGVQTTTQDILSQSRTPGFNFLGNPLGTNTAANPSSVGTQGFNSMSLGRVNGELGFGGLVLSAQSSSISVLLRALAAKRTVHVLSRPQITALDNQLAQINVGQLVPRVVGVQTTAQGSANPQVQDAQVGIILTVTPRVRPDNSVVMETVARSSSLSGQGVPIFTDINTGNVVESPIINDTTAQTTVAVPNGQTIVLGGLITKSDDTIERKVPWLGDIPILQYAFRYDSTSTRRTELLIFLTPRIVADDADAELIKQIESERLHFIEEDAEKIHGPLYSVPRSASGDMPAPVSLSPRSTPGEASTGEASTGEGNVTNISYAPTVGGVPSSRRPRSRGFLTETRKPANQSESKNQGYIKKKRGFFSFPWAKD